MIRDRCSDSPPLLLAVDRVCVIANYRLIDLRNVRMLVHIANCEGLSRLRVSMRTPMRIEPYSFRICNEYRANCV